MLSILTAIPGVANLINKVLIPDGAGDYQKDAFGKYEINKAYADNSASGKLA